MASSALAFTAGAKKEAPGVYTFELKKVYQHEEGVFLEHPPLEAGHPRVGNWSEAEMWDQEVKNPVTSLGGFMYAMDCKIGTPYEGHVATKLNCIFDSTTSISSTMSWALTTYATHFWDPHESTTLVDLGVTK